MKKISTTALSKILDFDTRDVFDEMADQKLMYPKDKHWHLTKKGQEFGGETVFTKKHGEFIVWPESFDPFNLKEDNRQELVNSTGIGKNFELSPQRINLILTEIGWTEKAIKGWSVTSLGRSKHLITEGSNLLSDADEQFLKKHFDKIDGPGRGGLTVRTIMESQAFFVERKSNYGISNVNDMVNHLNNAPDPI